MANLPRQDRNGVRTPQGLEQKYRLNKTKQDVEEQSKTITQQGEELKEQSKSLEQISEELENKVDKEEGKGLSSNDFTDEDKEKLDGITAHSHSNLTTLNKITEEIWTKITKAIKSDEYNLSTYKTSDVTTIGGKFFVKNDRAVINAELVLNSSLTNTSIILLQNLPIDTNIQYKFEFNDGNYEIANKKLTVNFSNAVVTNLILNLVFDLYESV